MRRALLVGIDDYPVAPLTGCVNDVTRMHEVLSKNEDQSPNFGCRLMIAPCHSITKASLRQPIEELFANAGDVALFYFSGHGTANNLGGFLVTQDAERYDEGLPMNHIITLANKSKVREVVVVLDCCHSGALGNLPEVDNMSVQLREGISILSASRSTQAAVESGGGGVFTSLVVDALTGGASDVLGNVTIASLMAYVDQALGPWEQRPVFKSHLSKLRPLRKCKPSVGAEILRKLPTYFPTDTFAYPLDPSYEPDSEPLHPEHQEIFSHLQMLRAARLLEPIGEEHMYYAAMKSKSCRLTPLGRYYWQLARKGYV